MADSYPGSGEYTQEREYFLEKILEAFPERQHDPLLLYGNTKAEYLSLVNAGLIKEGGNSDGIHTSPQWSSTLPTVQGLKGDYTGRWGTVGTGTDDRASMQAMISAGSKKAGNYQWSELNRKGVSVTIPAGTYILGAPESGSTLTIPEGVHVDFSAAMIFTDYPSTSRSDWSAILILNGGSINPPLFMGPSGRNAAPVEAPNASNTNLLYDGIRLLGNNNVASTVIAKTAAEIKGYQGASIRGIGTWVTRFEGPIKLSSRFGYIASNWPANNVYGYAHTNALPGIIGTTRNHTDVYFNGPYFNENRNGGYLGVVTGAPDKPHELEFSNAGGHQAYFTGCVFEHFADYAFLITGGLISMTDCAFEECGKDGQGLGWFNSVQSVAIKNLRINLRGTEVTDSTGTKVSPYLPTIFKINAVQLFTFEGGYYRNTRSMSKFADNAAAVYDVLAPRIDSNPFTESSVMINPLGKAMSSSLSKTAKFGSAHLWVDTVGNFRVSKTVPVSDTDGMTLNGVPTGTVSIDSFPGATGADQLRAAMAYASAQTRKPALMVKPGASYHAGDTPFQLYDGFKMIGPSGGETELGYGTKVWVSGTNGVFATKASGPTTGILFKGISFDGTVESGFIKENPSDSSAGYLQYSAFENVTFNIFKYILRSPLLGVTWTGPTYVNNVVETAFILSGSDNSLFTDGLFLDQNYGTTAEQRAKQYGILQCIALNKTSFGPLYITGDPGLALLIDRGGALVFNGARFEGRNAGKPTSGSVVRVMSGMAIFRDCWFAYGMSGQYPTGRTEAGIVHVFGGQVLIDGGMYERATNVAETVPFVHVSAGKAIVKNIMTRSFTAGKPLVTVANSSTGSAVVDETVTLTTPSA